jgi:hypothetical protein
MPHERCEKNSKLLHCVIQYKFESKNRTRLYIHRILVEADSSAESGDDLWSAVRDDLWSAVGEAGGNIYKRGDLKESQMADLDVYLLKKVERYTSVYNYQV